jgi:hypothetical protein
MSFWNAFRNTLGSEKFPHAPTYRRTFKEKIEHTFYVFAGSFFDKSERNHVGLFDYATLGIAYGLGRLLEKTSSIFSSSAVPLVFSFIIVGLINLPFIIARYAIAAILTFLALPFIFAVDRITASKSKELKQAVLTLEVDVVSHEKGETITKKQTIGSYLQERDMTLENLTTEVDFSNQGRLEPLDCDEKELTLGFRIQRVGASAGVGCDCHGGEHVDFSYKSFFIMINSSMLIVPLI